MPNLFREVSRNKYEPSTLTEEEEARKNRLATLNQLIDELQQERKTLLSECKHEWQDRIFFDVAGFPYDTRYCAVCNTCLESV